MAIEDYMDEARTFVLQCFEEDQVIREDTVRKLSRVVACWMDTSALFSNNETYYRSLLNKCAENLGPVRPKVFVQDDGGIVDEPLRAKLPELVAELAKMAKRMDAIGSNAIGVIAVSDKFIDVIRFDRHGYTKGHYPEVTIDNLKDAQRVLALWINLKMGAASETPVAVSPSQFSDLPVE